MKSEILKALKASPAHISGQELSARLGVTRAAVWKAVHKLMEEGYEIQSVPNRGYKLLRSPDLLTADELADGLETRWLGHPIFCYDTVDSTNTQAKLSALQGAPHGSLFIAECQTAGKGRLGRSWASAKDEGIWMTALLRPQVAPQAIVPITLATGLAICEALRDTTGVQALIKWPNDIVAEGRKLGGILTELQAEAERIGHVAVGMGINVNTTDFPEEIGQVATSLKLLTGRTVERKPIAQCILQRLEVRVEQLLGEGFEAMRSDYSALCVTLGREVTATFRSEAVQGWATGITPQGDLILSTPDGERTVTAGEVSVRGIYGYVN